MEQIKKKFNCRIEELPVIAGFVSASFGSNLLDFTEYSPDYQQPFHDNFKAKLAVVEGIVFPKKLIGELKKITKNLYGAMETLRDPLNRLEGYVGKAVDLTLDPSDFGIKELRAAITKKDPEKFLMTLATVIQNIDANMAQLTEKGFKQAGRDFLANAKLLVKENNDLQNSKVSEKEALVTANIEKLNEVWKVVQDILKSGKILYKNSDQNKTKEFTLTALKARVRVERTKEETEPQEVPPVS